MQFNLNNNFMVLLMLLIIINVLNNNIKLLFLEHNISRNNWNHVFIICSYIWRKKNFVDQQRDIEDNMLHENFFFRTEEYLLRRYN